MCRAESAAGVQVTVEYRSERSERGYAAKALARRWSERMLPKASRQENAIAGMRAAAQRPTYWPPSVGGPGRGCDRLGEREGVTPSPAAELAAGCDWP